MNLFDCTKTSFKSVVFGEVDGTHTSAPDSLEENISFFKNFICLDSGVQRNLELGSDCLDHSSRREHDPNCSERSRIYCIIL
jgi:hypothetical protein